MSLTHYQDALFLSSLLFSPLLVHHAVRCERAAAAAATATGGCADGADGGDGVLRNCRAERASDKGTGLFATSALPRGFCVARERPLAFAPAVLGGSAEPCPHCGCCVGVRAAAVPDGAGGSAHGGTAEQEEEAEADALPHCSAACHAAHGARHRAELPLLEPALLLLCGLDESVLPFSRLLLVLRLLLHMGGDADSATAVGDDDAGAGATGLGGLSDHLAEATALSQGGGSGGGGDGDGDGDGSSAASNQYLAQARLASAGLAAILLSSSAGPLSAGGGGSGAAVAAGHVESEALRLLMVARVNGFELVGQRGANGGAGAGAGLGGSGGCALFARIAALNHD